MNKLFFFWSLYPTLFVAVLNVGRVGKIRFFFPSLTIILLFFSPGYSEQFLYYFSCFSSFLTRFTFAYIAFHSSFLSRSSHFVRCSLEYEFELSCHVISLSVRHSNKMDVCIVIPNVKTYRPTHEKRRKKNHTHSKLHWTHMEIRDVSNDTLNKQNESTNGVKT